MEASYHRHDISDEMWSVLEPHLPGQRGQWGTVHQRFIRWRRKGIWEKLLKILIDEPEFSHPSASSSVL